MDHAGAEIRNWSYTSHGSGVQGRVVGSLAPTAVRRDGKVVVIPAGLSIFRVRSNGKLDFIRKYDLDVGTLTQWWTGMIPLP